MNPYAEVLKQLLQYTETKYTTLSQAIDYDMSYISKWVNGATPYDFDREVPDYLEVVVPPGEQRVLKCVAVTPAGRRSMVVTTRLGNPGE